jgi:hypothetical protein
MARLRAVQQALEEPPEVFHEFSALLGQFRRSERGFVRDAGTAAYTRPLW